MAYVCAELDKCMQDSQQLKAMTLLTLASTQGQVQFIIGGEEGNRNNAVATKHKVLLPKRNSRLMVQTKYVKIQHIRSAVTCC